MEISRSPVDLSNAANGSKLGICSGAKSLRGWGHNRLSLCGFCANTAFPVNQLQAGNKALFQIFIGNWNTKAIAKTL